MLYRNPVPLSMQQYMELFEKAFKEANTPAVIRKDVAGLRELYTWVAQNGGCWAPKRLR
jgi:hypothetical protein